MIDMSTIINVVTVLFSLIVGLLVKSMSAQVTAVLKSLEDLRNADTVMGERMSNISIMIAGNYMKRDEVQAIVDRAVLQLRNELTARYGERARHAMPNILGEDQA